MTPDDIAARLDALGESQMAGEVLQLAAEVKDLLATIFRDGGHRAAGIGHLPTAVRAAQSEVDAMFQVAAERAALVERIGRAQPNDAARHGVNYALGVLIGERDTLRQCVAEFANWYRVMGPESVSPDVRALFALADRLTPKD